MESFFEGFCLDLDVDIDFTVPPAVALLSYKRSWNALAISQTGTFRGFSLCIVYLSVVLLWLNLTCSFESLPLS